jgi:carboxyl-terminal processing protease
MLCKKLFFIFVILVFTWGVKGQFPVAVDVAYDFIKTNSIHRYQVNWNHVDQQFWAAISSAHNLNDTMDAFVQVLKSLDDVHGQLYLHDQYYGCWPTNEEHSAEERLSQLMQKAKATTGKIKCDLLDGQYAYIRVPGFDAYGSEAVDLYSKALRDTIDQWGQKKVKGFILDLRLNMGGNIYPMLNGLGHLLGEGEIAYEVDVSYLLGGIWRIQNGNFITNSFLMTNLEEREVNGLNQIPIVVLIGPVTASAGSVTAITFKGRKNTCFIGEPTAAGYTTSNGYFQFGPDFFMNFAISYMADRNMRFYPSSVDPDITVVQGDDFENLMRDQKIKRALLWLNGL